MSVYYNEIDPFCCMWLRQLIKCGLLPDGEIDNRSIEDVRPDELRGFAQCHFFAGIGGWPYALRLVGWPDDRSVWTGSCPCQPFSAAGKRAGTSDERHLWPSFFWLISQCRPDTIIGEQVASKDALAWWDIVHTDLEAEGYACGVCDTCAAGYGAPHIRQRLYWLAQSQPYGRGRRYHGDTERYCGEIQIEGRGLFGKLADTECSGLQRQSQSDRTPQRWQEQAGCSVNPSNVACRVDFSQSVRMEDRPEGKPVFGETDGTGIYGFDSASQVAGGMVYPNGSGRNRGIFPQASGTDGQAGQFATDGGVGVAGASPTNGFWANPDWLWCRDKKWRPIESGIVPLVDGFSKGMVRGRDSRAIRQRLQGYGNAIVVPQAVEFIKAVMEVL